MEDKNTYKPKEDVIKPVIETDKITPKPEPESKIIVDEVKQV